MIEKTLEKIGLNKKEIDIYIVLVKNGKLVANDISKITDINRTTVYTVLRELLKKI